MKTPAKQPWTTSGKIPQMRTDSTGVSKLRYINPNSKQEAHQRYERRKNASKVALAGMVDEGRPPDGWLLEIQSRYKADAPMRFTLDTSAPAVSAEMFGWGVPQLQRLSPGERQAIARVFLSAAMKYMGSKTLKGSYLKDGNIYNYVPPNILAHFRFLQGKGEYEVEQ